MTYLLPTTCESYSYGITDSFIYSIENIRTAAIESFHFRVQSNRKRFSGIECVCSVGWLSLLSICESWMNDSFLRTRFKTYSKLNSRCVIRWHTWNLIMRIYAHKNDEDIEHVCSFCLIHFFYKLNGLCISIVRCFRFAFIFSLMFSSTKP